VLLWALVACQPVVVEAAAKIAAKPVSAPDAGLVIGEFELASEPVVDGDTIKVMGLDKSLRLLGIDAEETFKNEADRLASSQDWELYLKNKRHESLRPVKMATPLGEEAKAFAKEFFKGVTKVRLERDHTQEIRDRYHRYLAYILVERDGQSLNYNVECVRAGLSPYFMKYGYARRYHDAFVTAAAEAKMAGRGIWDAGKQHYPDYPERLAWWEARAQFVQAFERAHPDSEGGVVLSRADAEATLRAAVGKEVWVLGTVAKIQETKGPTLVLLGMRPGLDLPLVFFDKGVLLNSRLLAASGEFVAARGVVSLYKNQKRQSEELQIQILDPGQVTSTVAKDAPMEAPTAAGDADD